MSNEDYKIAYENVMIANKMLEQEIERLNNIINKAIEYIQGDIEDNYFKRYDDEVYKMCEDLLDILKGDDKE